MASAPSVVVIWMQRFEETGGVAAKPSGGSTSRLEAHAQFLLDLIKQKPDLTLDEIVAAMRKRRIAGSRSAAWRFFNRRNISFKKTLYAAEQKRADVARARRRWMREQGMFDPARLVFIDETCTNTAMVRLRGRALRGERLVDYVPHGAWKTITFVGGLRQCGMTAAERQTQRHLGGSIRPMIYSLAAEAITRERLSELKDWLDNRVVY